MRTFTEFWKDYLICSPTASKLLQTENQDNIITDFFSLEKWSPMANEIVRKSHENPTIGILLCKSADKAFVEYVIRDYSTPMGVATYKNSAEMNQDILQAMPDIEELKKIL